MKELFCLFVLTGFYFFYLAWRRKNADVLLCALLLLCLSAGHSPWNISRSISWSLIAFTCAGFMTVYHFLMKKEKSALILAFFFVCFGVITYAHIPLN